MNQLMFQQHHKLWVILPAAGSGSRFSKTELKQYQMIQEQTVLEHTVSRLNQLPLAGYVLQSVHRMMLPRLCHFRLDKAHFAWAVQNASTLY